MSVHTKKSDTVPERYAHVEIYNSDLASRATVFARLIDGVWLTSISYCSNHDHFDRKIGRNVARRRFFAGNDPTPSIGTEFTYEAAKKVAEQFAPAPR